MSTVQKSSSDLKSKKTLEGLKAAFAKSTNNNENFTSGYFPFWNMKEGERAIVRFLPDANENNPFGFLVQKVMHILEINGEKKSVPCLSMYEEDCPICKVSQDYYKVKDEVNGRKFWKKKQYLTQALIIEDPLPMQQPDDTHEGQLRFVALGHQIYQVIQEAFKSDDVLDAIPYNFEDGYDFTIKKSKSGKYDAYNIGSAFARKQRSLTDEELAVVAEHLTDLSLLLPKHPGREKVEAMLQAALTNSDYKDDNGFSDNETTDELVPPKRKTSKPGPAQPVDDDDDNAPFTTQPATKTSTKKVVEQEVEVKREAKDEVDDLLTTIRKRRAAAATKAA